MKITLKTLLKQFDEVVKKKYPATCPYCDFVGKYLRPTLGVAQHIIRRHPEKYKKQSEILSDFFKQSIKDAINAVKVLCDCDCHDRHNRAIYCSKCASYHYMIPKYEKNVDKFLGEEIK